MALELEFYRNCAGEIKGDEASAPKQLHRAWNQEHECDTPLACLDGSVRIPQGVLAISFIPIPPLVEVLWTSCGVL